MADPQTPQPTPAAARRAEGIELMGQYKGSGFKEPPYLVRRVDGQVIQMSRLLYLVTAEADGHRSHGQIAGRVSQEFGRSVSADNVRFLVEKKLRPLGVLAEEDGSIPELRRINPLLGLRFRVRLVPERVVRVVATVFRPLFLPPVVIAVLGGLLALDAWLFFAHGLTQSFHELLYQPALVLMFFGIGTIATTFHEFGHATACRYGGAKPGAIGVGIYVVFSVFYSDVTDSYRLGKAGRLRTDLGGMYFDAIFTLAIAGAYFLTGFEPLLVFILFQQLSALDEFTPFARFDGYYVVSDLTGVPDLFGRIKPILKSMIPGQGVDDRVKELKPWVRAVVTVWVLTTVTFLLYVSAMFLSYLPWVLATAWDSLLIQYGKTSSAFGASRIVEGIVGLFQIGSLAVPVVGIALLAALIAKRLGVAARRASKDKPLLRTGFLISPVAAAGLLLFVWWSHGYH